MGAGFAGASTAYHLKRAGAGKIIVVEREPVPGAHASGKNAAMAFEALRDSLEARLAAEGRDFLASPPAGFCGEPLFEPTGSLLVACGEEALGEAAREAARGGIEVERLTWKEAGELHPVLLGCTLAGAIWNRRDGVVDIHALLQGYLRGQEIWYGCEVERIESRKGRVESVVTSRGRIATSVVVNAAGAWAGEVGRRAGASPIVITPRRRHLFQTEVDMEVSRLWPFVWHLEVDAYFRPEGRGLLMSPCDADPHPPSVPLVAEKARDSLAEKIGLAFPPLAHARIVSGWACLRSFSDDERFVIGPDPELRGFFWVAGLGGHGMTTSSAVGRLAASAASGRMPAEAAAFDPARLCA